MQLFHTKALCSPFMCLQFGFVIFWQNDLGAKAAHKMLVKLTPGVNLLTLFGKLDYFTNRRFFSPNALKRCSLR
jgi:hypothetical protein